MNQKNTGIIALVFVIIAIVAIVMTTNNRPETSDQLSSLESRFLDVDANEKKKLVERFELNDIEDIRESIEKYKTILIPAVEEELQAFRQKVLDASTDEEKQLLQESLLRKIKERRAMKSTLEGYIQLETWYFENKSGVLDEFQNVEIISEEVAVIE